MELGLVCEYGRVLLDVSVVERLFPGRCLPEEAVDCWALNSLRYIWCFCQLSVFLYSSIWASNSCMDRAALLSHTRFFSAGSSCHLRPTSRAMSTKDSWLTSGSVRSWSAKLTSTIVSKCVISNRQRASVLLSYRLSLASWAHWDLAGDGAGTAASRVVAG